MPKSSDSLKIKIIGWLLIIALLYGFVELSAWVVLRTQIFENGRDTRLENLASSLSQKQKDGILAALARKGGMQIDDDLGWVTPARGTGHVKRRSKGQTRILAFGDSFTWGDGMGDDDVWTQVLDDMIPESEVINFGVSAYGLDQAYIRYLLEGKNFDHDTLIIGFIIEDADRNITSFRPFKLRGTGLPYAKPRFVLEEDQLQLIPNPLKKEDYRTLAESECIQADSEEREDCKNPNFIRNIYKHLPSVRLTSLLWDNTMFIDVSNEEKAIKFNLTAKIFLEFYREAEKNGAKPLILLMPRRAELENGSPLIGYEEFFEKNNLHFINATPQMRKFESRRSLFQGNGHYSALGNSMIAEIVHAYMKSDAFMNGSPVQDEAPVVDNPTTTYRFVRWEVTKKRSLDITCQETHCVQASEFVLLKNGKRVALPNGFAADNGSGGNPSNEGALSLMDDTRTTKWLDHKFNEVAEPTQEGISVLTFDAGEGSSIEFNGYRWATANDNPGRDPVSWNIYGSQDGSSYILLDSQTDQPITTARAMYTDEYSVVTP